MMYHQYRPGYVEVISGCMFAGKTEELIRRIKVLEFAKKKVLVFKPAIDNRYSETKVVSHAGSEVDSIVIREAKEILNYVDDSVDVIAIDEVQFFDEDIIEICDYYAKKGKRVMAAGLDMDFKGEPFGRDADSDHQGGICHEADGRLYDLRRSGNPHAAFSQRRTRANYDDPIILVGASGKL